MLEEPGRRGPERQAPERGSADLEELAPPDVATIDG
jgi:hypothetical protein